MEPRHKLSATLALAAMAFVFLHYPPQFASAQDRNRLSDPYAGVVSDSTITLIGQEFYREFVAAWRDQALVDHFSISVHERPSARWGSLIWVEYANRQLFRAYLSPARRDIVRAAARDASHLVYEAVVDSEVQRALFRDPDLARDEF